MILTGRARNCSVAGLGLEQLQRRPLNSRGAVVLTSSYVPEYRQQVPTKRGYSFLLWSIAAMQAPHLRHLDSRIVALA